MKGAAVLGAVAILAGGAVAANATSLGIRGSGDASLGTKISNLLKADLTAEQKATIGAKIAAREKERAAKQASLTAEQKAAREAKIEARQEERSDRRAAIETAIANNNYNAWVIAVGANSHLAASISAPEFPRYVQAYNLEKQAQQILVDIGLKNEGSFHLGFEGELSASAK